LVRNAACIGIALSLVASVFGIDVAVAQTREVALARQLFDEGVGLVDQGEWEQAADRFQRSLDLRPSPIVAYNLGSALVELGRLVEASEAYRITILDETSSEQVSRAARTALQEMEPRIGRLTLELTGDTEGVEVFIDDRPLPPQAIGVAAPIDPGTRRIHATRSGVDVAEIEIEIANGAREEASLDIPERPADEPDPILSTGAATEPVADEEEGGGVLSSPWFWIVTGAVVAGAVVVVLLLTLGGGDSGDPVAGNLSPPIVEF